MGQRSMFAFVMLGIAGCTQGSNGSDHSGEALQMAYDFSVAQDRARCATHGVEYIGSAGPYAAYEVMDTASGTPYLECPDAVAPQADTYTMLCGAAGYFRRSDTRTLPTVDQQLKTKASSKSEAMIAALDTKGYKVGTCLRAKDFFNQRVPTMKPIADSGVTPPVDGGAYVPPGNYGDPDAPYSGVRLYLSGDTQAGDVHFVRMIGINFEQQQHNPSHSVPQICCNELGCALNTLPQPPPVPVSDGGGVYTASDGGTPGYDAGWVPPIIIY